MQLFDENGWLTDTGIKLANKLYSLQLCRHVKCDSCSHKKDDGPGGSGCIVENIPNVDKTMVTGLIQAYVRENFPPVKSLF